GSRVATRFSLAAISGSFETNAWILAAHMILQSQIPRFTTSRAASWTVLFLRQDIHSKEVSEPSFRIQRPRLLVGTPNMQVTIPLISPAIRCLRELLPSATLPRR